MILKKILELAEKNNISVSCLEKTLGFGNGTIKKWGESSPSVDKLKKVADYFGVSIEYFLEQEKESEKILRQQMELLEEYSKSCNGNVISKLCI